MEHESISTNNDEVEDGEVSDSDDDYTPLQRPDHITPNDEMESSTTIQPVKLVDDEDSISACSEESSDDSDDGFKVKKLNKKQKVKAVPIEKLQTVTPKPNNKYQIWSASLQEESLMENLQGCDVTKNKMRNRDVESYDYSLGYRLEGEVKSLKRRKSPETDNYYSQNDNKRSRGHNNQFNNRRSVKDRLGARKNSFCDNLPRSILDLVITLENTDEEIAKDIANKLCEEKDSLMLRVINVLGKTLPINTFLETQQIESNGGMLIINGGRRRTPGGVFLYLIKNNPDITNSDKKDIFQEERKIALNEKKMEQALNRERKVEELKKTLNLNELPTLVTRTETAMSHLTPKSNSMSNPPPSPVNDDVNPENSSDYDSHKLHHVNISTSESPEKVVKDSELNRYDDDFLDMNCDDMEMF